MRQYVANKIYYLFLGLIVLVIIWLHVSGYLSVNYLNEKFSKFGYAIGIVFFIIATFRIFLLIPHTTFVILALLLFPGKFWLIFFLSVITLFTSGSLLYLLGDKIKILNFRNNPKVEIIKHKLKEKFDKYGIFIIALWSIVPIFNNDLLIYSASVLHIKYWKFMGIDVLFHAVLYAIIIWGSSLFPNIIKFL